MATDSAPLDDFLTGKQLVVRMQYDDSITVSRCHLDKILNAIDQVAIFTTTQECLVRGQGDRGLDV